MTRLQTDRLKSSRTDTAEENRPQTTRPRVIGTSDTDGVSIDLRATPGYQDTQLTTGDLKPELVTDGGSEVETDVYCCGDCEKTFTDDAVLSSYTVEATGEEVNYSTGACPHCETLLTDDQTLSTTATFDLSEAGQ